MTAKGYYQANMLDYYLGTGMEYPETPDIRYVGDEAENGFDESAVYEIKNVNSGRVLDVYKGSAENGANVQQWANSGSKASNTWKLKSDGNGYYYIISGVGGGNTYYLDVADGSPVNGANIQIWQNTNSDAQLFKLIPNNDGSYTIAAKCSGGMTCVEAADASTDAGANIQTFEMNGNNCQKWFINKVG